MFNDMDISNDSIILCDEEIKRRREKGLVLRPIVEERMRVVEELRNIRISKQAQKRTKNEDNNFFDILCSDTDDNSSCEEKDEKVNNVRQTTSDKKITKYLNKVYNTNCEWNKTIKKDKSVHITHNGNLCLVDNSHDCDDSCLIVNKDKIMASCHTHGQKKQNKKRFRNFYSLLKIKQNIKRKKIDISGCDYDSKLIDFVYTNHTDAHDDVSHVFYSLFHNTLVCADETSKYALWYHFKGGIWNETKGLSKLKRFLNIDVAKFYTFANDVFVKYSEGTGDIDYPQYKDIFENEVEYNQYESIYECSKEVEKVLRMLKNGGYCNQLLNHCIHHFKDDDFINKLDEKIHLLCFGEYVYNLKTCTWRKTEAYDYCSKVCGVTKEQINDKNLKKVNKILSDMFEDKEKRDYFLNLLTDLLYGKNQKEIFQVWQGLGANGKGVIATLLQAIFHDYYAECNVTLLTQKSISANSASPELARLQGVRIAMFEEPENGSKLNSGMIKKITGGAKITARNLYANSKEFFPHFTPIIQCNTNFSLENITDDSIPRRLRFLEFENQFVSAEDIKLEAHKLRDDTLKDKESIDKLKGSFMYLLLKRWKASTDEYKSYIHNYIIPKSIFDTQQEFLDDNNLTKLFVTENIEIIPIQERVENKLEFIKLKDMISSYKRWFAEREEKKCKIKRRIFKSRINKYLPKLFKERYQKHPYNIKSVYIHCKFIEEEEEGLMGGYE